MNPTHSFPQRENIFAEIENFAHSEHFLQRKALYKIFIIPVYQRQMILPFLLLLMHAFSATHPPTMCLTSTPCLFHPDFFNLQSQILLQISRLIPLIALQSPHPRTDPAPHMATRSKFSILIKDSIKNCSQTP